MIPLFKPYNDSNTESAILEAIRSGMIASGPNIAKFEGAIGELLHQEYVVSTSDMTAAMLIALHLSGVTPGDEVMTSAFTCLASSSAIRKCGANPVWIDLCENESSLSIEDIEKKISKKTKALVIYHLSGYPSRTLEISDLCREHNIALIEDCNNSLYAIQDGRPVGVSGRFSIYSFYPNRQINCLEGGALVCKSSDDAARARQLRRFGIDQKSFRMVDGEINPYSDIQDIGWSASMNNVNASFGLAQMSDSHTRISSAQRNAIKILGEIENSLTIRPLPFTVSSMPSFWTLLMLSPRKKEIAAHLKTNGVQVSTLHQCNDVYTGFNAVHGDLCNVRKFQEEIFAVPCGWWLSDQDIDKIISTLRSA